MRTCVNAETGEVLRADILPDTFRRDSLRCRNPQCGERVVHVRPKSAIPHFRHAAGVADLETCFYSWEAPTERQYASVTAVEAWLAAQFPQVPMRLEEWIIGVSWPLDILLTHGDGRRWGFWYVSTRRLKVTKNLMRQCQEAGLHLIVFTHSELRQPRDIFASPSQVAFAINPDTSILTTPVASGPISDWRLDENGQLVAPRNQPSHAEASTVQIDPRLTPRGQWGPFGVPEELWQAHVLDHFSTTYLRAGESFPVYTVAQYNAEKGWLAASHQWQDDEVLQAVLGLWQREEEQGKVRVVRGRGIWTVYPRVSA